ncbi:MAG: hypothetical protein PWP23_2238 [Candidatus Sumerlaeota bacterium]|nr:hypothetical protein [Candidatus Sumerlaeota bacterium]
MAFAQKTEVLVVGAGPVGLLTAVMLAERGVDCWIIDRARRTNVRSYALALHPQTLRMLDDIGLLEPVLKQANLLRRTSFYEGSTERLIIDYDKLDVRHPYIAVLPQSALEAVLEERLRQKGIEVRWQHELIELDLGSPDHATATIHHTGDAPQGYPVLDIQPMVLGRRTVKARYVIGADGYHSTVRKVLEIPRVPCGNKMYFSLYEFESTQDVGSEMRIVASDGMLSVLWPLPGGWCRWAFGIANPGEHNSSLDQLRRLVGERAPWFSGLPLEIGWAACVRFEPYRLDTFGSGRVWLTGDAAHLSSPLGVHSMNVAFHEGHDLASRIFEILRNSVPEDILLAYSSSRRREWQALLDPQQIEVGPAASSWTRVNAHRIVPSIPAAGRDLAALLAQVGVTIRDL